MLARDESASDAAQTSKKWQFSQQKNDLCVPRKDADESEVIERNGSFEVFIPMLLELGQIHFVELDPILGGTRPLVARFNRREHAGQAIDVLGGQMVLADLLMPFDD